MSWDEEFDEEYDDALEYEDSDYSSPKSEDTTDKDEAGDGLNPMDITDPASAFFFLSDDAQDDLQGSEKTKMRCLTCGHKFLGEIYDDCPECLSPDTEEINKQDDSEPF
jgi:rubrerythrin